jgi:DNA-binding MarR family transcriptional regulator/AcrR family transcriptional regulator
LENARVSRRTFYEFFSGVEASLLDALGACLESATEQVLPAYETATGGWSERIRVSLATLLGFFDAEPHTAKMLLVESKAAGPKAVQWHQEVLARIAVAIDEGRAEAPSEPPPLTAEGVVGAVLSVLYGRVLESEPQEPLIELLNPLMSIIVSPYLGPGPGRKELSRALPQSRPQRTDKDNHDHNGAIVDLNIRVTYRTIRVLTAISSQPGASNRAVAEAAGVGDQGQISKHLKRLEGEGLIENKRLEELITGGSNQWWLTAHGESIVRMLNIDVATSTQ